MSQISQAWVYLPHIQEMLNLLQIQRINHYCWDVPLVFPLHSIGTNMLLDTTPPDPSPCTDGKIIVTVPLSVMCLEEPQPMLAVSIST